MQEAGIEVDSADASFLPATQVPLDADGARKVLRLVDALYVELAEVLGVALITTDAALGRASDVAEVIAL